MRRPLLMGDDGEGFMPRFPRSATAWSLLLVPLLVPCTVHAATAGPLLARLRAVGKEGAGSADAAAAWRQLVDLGPDALLEVLTALDGAEVRAANWIRSAADAIAERAVKG